MAAQNSATGKENRICAGRQQIFEFQACAGYRSGFAGPKTAELVVNSTLGPDEGFMKVEIFRVSRSVGLRPPRQVKSLDRAPVFLTRRFYTAAEVPVYGNF